MYEKKIEYNFISLLLIWGIFAENEKISEHNKSNKALVIFADLSLFRQIIPNINHKLMT